MKIVKIVLAMFAMILVVNLGLRVRDSGTAAKSPEEVIAAVKAEANDPSYTFSLVQASSAESAERIVGGGHKCEKSDSDSSLTMFVCIKY